MKTCPACKRTFDDMLTFCLIDGSVLSVPYDPQETKRFPDARSELPTETALPTIKRSRPLSTIAALPPSLPMAPRSNDSPSNVRRRIATRVQDVNWIGWVALIVFFLVSIIVVALAIKFS